MRGAILLALVVTVVATGCSDSDPAGTGGGAVDVAGTDQTGAGDDVWTADGGPDEEDAAAMDVPSEEEATPEPVDVTDDGTSVDASEDATGAEDFTDTDGASLTDTSGDTQDTGLEAEIIELDDAVDPTDVLPSDDAGPEPPTEPESNPMYEVGDDCVTPKDYVTAACEDVVCPGDQ
ncbi:MAG: hypothetical protein VX938_14175, partial [Myxococcota bacterium]|nr:hypothetical protein [Myxococcota bacterium]